MKESDWEHKLVDAYDTMIERVHHFLDEAEEHAVPTLEKNIERARRQAVEFRELTSEEADRIAAYVERDLNEAAQYLQTSGREFSSWFQFDLSLIEERVYDFFAGAADKTRVTLDRLAAQAKSAQQYHTGEIAGIGTLVCEECGTQMHYEKTGRIPPCPKCHATTFQRQWPQTD